MIRWFAVAVIAVCCVAGAAGQDVEPRFEVVSVKKNLSGLAAQSSQIGKGSISLVNMRLRAMLVIAFGIRPERIEGPDWIERDRFDIVARAPEGTPDARLRPMIRTLLRERFQLLTRAETRDQPVYALVVGRADGNLGPSLKRQRSATGKGSTRFCVGPCYLQGSAHAPSSPVAMDAKPTSPEAHGLLRNSFGRCRD